jgi:hypothetical protein
VQTATPHPWVQDGDGYRCVRHGVRFVPPKTCAKCDADPGPDLADEIDEHLAAAPTGCMDSLALERWFVAVAKSGIVAANRVSKLKHKDFHDEGSIAKHRETAIKAMRAAAELTGRREDADLVRAREKRIRDRAKGASH